MARSFSDDGAAGAFGGGTDTGAPSSAGTPPSTGGDLPNPITEHDPGPSAGGAADMTPGSAPHTINRPYVQPQAPANGVLQQPTGRANIGFSFSAGGAVPDDDDSDATGDLMAKALQSVDATLQYSYKKYGLSGGQQETAAMPMRPGTQSEHPGGGTYGPGGSPPKPQETAGMMPTIPGNQSETPGPYTPQQPQPQPQETAGMMPTIPGNQSETPGPYTPQPKPQETADASDSEGAINTDEEAA